MEIETFEMERWQSAHEDEVALNLSESGVRALKATELLNEGEEEGLLELELGYPVPPGSDTLRGRIAAWYPHAAEDNVTVTNGGAEANFLVLWTLLGTSDRLAFMLPDYMQGWGLGRTFGEEADAFHLRLGGTGSDRRWELDLEELGQVATSDTKIIWVCNPNNPTGAVLSESEMDGVIEVARRVDAYIVADEIYRGAEVDGNTTPTFWGRYDKVVITSGLSKAFGLAGLRLGWVVAPPEVIREVWRHRDYTTLMIGHLSDELGSRALEPSKREWILDRTRSIVRKNVRVVNDFAAANDFISYAPPKAGAIAYLEYDLPIDSGELVDRFRREQSVLVVPGDQLGLSRGFRVGFGYDMDKTQEGLRRITDLMTGIEP